MDKDFAGRQFEEAVKRIQKIGFIENVLKDFKEGVLNKSERAGFAGMLYWLDENEKNFVRKWEEKSGNLAYHVIKDNTELGIMYSILYISKYEDEWEIDNEDLESGIAIAYCGIGLDDTFFEHGTIGIHPVNGGLKRIW